MIPFDTWFPQIVGYIEFVSDDAELWRAWVDRDFSHTSVTDFDELYEQLFDDLDSDNLEPDMLGQLPNEDARTAVASFLAAIRGVDRERAITPALMDARTLLTSSEWKSVQRVATDALRRLALLPGQ